MRPPAAQITLVCRLCKKDFTILARRYREGGGKFCSLSCSAKYTGFQTGNKCATTPTGPSNPSWKGGAKYKRSTAEAKRRDRLWRDRKAGRVQRLSCAVCDKRETWAYFYDRDGDSIIVWLCRSHYRQVPFVVTPLLRRVKI